MGACGGGGVDWAVWQDGWCLLEVLCIEEDVYDKAERSLRDVRRGVYMLGRMCVCFEKVLSIGYVSNVFFNA